MGSGQDGKTGFRRGVASNRRGRGGFALVPLLAFAVMAAFSPSFFDSGAGFGDIVRGSSSLAVWDYFAFGVVPEPSTATLAAVALGAWRAANPKSKIQDRPRYCHE